MNAPHAITLELTIATSTPGNNRCPWFVSRAEAQRQRKRAREAVNGVRAKPPFPCIVTITRLSPRKMDRHNLYGAMKHVIDGIADAYGVDDGDERWEFRCVQEPARAIGVRIRIEAAEPGDQGVGGQILYREKSPDRMPTVQISPRIESGGG